MLELRDGRDLTYVLITHNLSLAWVARAWPERTDRVVLLAGDIVRSKALDFLVEYAETASEGESLRANEDSPWQTPSLPEQDRAEEQP